jgi:hypothetical protein
MPQYANIGEEILALLRSKADAEWVYYNPYFLNTITDKIEAYYGVEDEVVNEWIIDMFGA